MIEDCCGWVWERRLLARIHMRTWIEGLTSSSSAIDRVHQVQTVAWVILQVIKNVSFLGWNSLARAVLWWLFTRWHNSRVILIWGYVWWIMIMLILYCVNLRWKARIWVMSILKFVKINFRDANKWVFASGRRRVLSLWLLSTLITRRLI